MPVQMTPFRLCGPFSLDCRYGIVCRKRRAISQARGQGGAMEKPVEVRSGESWVGRSPVAGDADCHPIDMPTSSRQALIEDTKPLVQFIQAVEYAESSQSIQSNGRHSINEDMTPAGRESP
jgi:hypothetical protein